MGNGHADICNSKKNSENLTESNFFSINSRSSYCHLSEEHGEYITWCMHASHLRENLKHCFYNVLHKCLQYFVQGIILKSAALWKNSCVWVFPMSLDGGEGCHSVFWSLCISSTVLFYNLHVTAFCEEKWNHLTQLVIVGHRNKKTGNIFLHRCHG